MESKKHLHALRVLVDADLKNGRKNEKAIKRFYEEENYEALSEVKKVFKENGEEMPRNFNQ